jgi:hypothetical protein
MLIVVPTNTNALPESGLFVECLKQSSKTEKLSAKALPGVTLGKKSSTNCISATTSLSSTFYWALGEDFAECHLVLGKRKVVITTPGNGVYAFAECCR